MKRGNSSSSSSSEDDRISSLPDCLIHHILSFINTVYVVRTCVLSKRWRYIWTSMLVLKFSDSFDYFEDRDKSDDDEDEDSDESDDNEDSDESDDDDEDSDESDDDDEDSDKSDDDEDRDKSDDDEDSDESDDGEDRDESDDDDDEDSDESDDDEDSDKSDDEGSNKGFIKYVDKVLSLRKKNSAIQRFHLDCSEYYYTPLHKMYRWIATAVKRNVQELYIETYAKNGFEIPPCLCACESLTKMELKLTGWEDVHYENKIILPLKMSLPRLKSLRLELEDIQFDDEKLTNRFFSSFPSLESLVMEIKDHGSHNMNLYISLPKLEYFEFDNENDYYNVSNNEVVLHAPRLTSFTLNSHMSASFTLENLSSLVTADIEIHFKEEDQVPGSYDVCAEKKLFYAQRTMRLLSGVQNVKVLALGDSFLKALGGAPDILDTQPLEFFNLQNLKIQTYLSSECLRTIICILKNSPNIEFLSLQITQLSTNKRPVYPYCDEVKYNSENPGDYWEVQLSLPCMLHHLKVVEINGLLGCVNEVKFLDILLKHAVVLEKMVLASYSTKQGSLREKRMKKFSEMVLKFPRASKNIIILSKF